jgi:hypothetical protein
MIGWFMAFNATFNNISVISWWSVLLEEEFHVSLELVVHCLCHLWTLQFDYQEDCFNKTFFFIIMYFMQQQGSSWS